jgi:hypothetical protein
MSIKTQLRAFDQYGNVLKYTLPPYALNSKTFLEPLNPNFIAKTNPNRAIWNESLNFKLPPEWTNGTVRFELVPVGDACSFCQEPAEVGGGEKDCEVMVTFQPSKTLEVNFIKVNWSSNPSYKVEAVDVKELRESLKAIFPVANVDVISSEIYFPYQPNQPLLYGQGFNHLNNVLYQQRLLDELSGNIGNRIYHGVFKGQNFDNTDVGKAVLLPLGHKTISSSYFDNSANYYNNLRNIHAHEIAHNLGRCHTKKTNQNISMQGFCDEKSYFCEQVFPWTYDSKAAIGPEAGDPLSPNAIYGLDSYSITKGNPFKFYFTPNPTENFELMSYCFNYSGFYNWISKYTYEALLEKINETFTKPQKSLTPQIYNVFRGIILIDSNSVAFSPFLEIETNSFTPLPEPGEYYLVLKDNNDNILSSISFSPELMFPEGNDELIIGLFIIPVPIDSNIKKVEIRRDSFNLGSITASNNVPTVEVLFPNGGESLTDSATTIQWIGSDLDMDSLTYTVQFSNDNGVSWRTLQTDYPYQNLTLNSSNLAGTSQGRIRVFVSDGFHSASDISDGIFTTANNSPELNFLAPTDSSTFVGEQPVFFEASAYDNEQGNLMGSSITWASSKDGLIGMGESLFTTADQLSEGVHTITVTAADAEGLTDSKSVTILICPEGCTGCNFEICNDLDDDCDGLVDEDDTDLLGATSWYADIDHDGYGDLNNTYKACEQPSNYVNNNLDCNDDNPSIHPQAEEICNQLDDNCDGETDNNVLNISDVDVSSEICAGAGNGTIIINASSLGGILFYSVSGGATYQGSNTFNNLSPGTYNIKVLMQGVGCSASTTATVGAGPNPTIWYKDIDNDGYTDGLTLSSCPQPTGYKSSALAGDCNDNDPLQFPGQTWYKDSDNDGYSNGQTKIQCNKPSGYKAASQLILTNGDCNDLNAAIRPGIAEVCNGIDDNCNGQNDEGISGQTYIGNVTFTTQAQINAWPTCYSKIQGNLTIQNSGINSLTKLSNLTQVTGNLTIKQTSLFNLNGLNNLATIGGSVAIFSNIFGAKLLNLDGLGALSHVGGNLSIYSNTSLTNCCAIHSLLNTPGGIVGAVSIHHNKAGCDNIYQINIACNNMFSPTVTRNLDGENIEEDEVMTKRTMKLFPNPASEEVTIIIEGAYRFGIVRIFDWTGRIMVNTEMVQDTKEQIVRVRDWQTGVYLVQLQIDGESLVQKLVIK